MKHKIVIFLTIFLAQLAALSPALAVTVPSFPACTSPQGETKVSYSEGTHGIVGSTASYIGSDTVYKTSDSTLVQCFCPKTGTTGVQSNWWKASSHSQDDIQILKNEGWNYVPNGALWGLEDAPYVVKNNEYACTSTGGGQVQSATAQIGDVFGLASTGTLMLIFGSGIVGVAFLLLGGYVYFSSRR